jgi:predicted alpha/beta-fold hydrolase
MPLSLMPHVWTIAPRLRHAVRPLAIPPFEPWETSLEDPRMGTVRLTGFLREVPEADEALVLVHGLGGSAESHYMGKGVLAAETAGLSCLRINLRGSDLLGEDYYHAGLTADVRAALASDALRRYRRLYVLGYSMGGHVALRLAAEPADPRLAAVAAICAPVDLALSQREIDSPGFRVYRHYLLSNLKKIYAAVAARKPVPFPVERTGEIRFFHDWDERIVAPRHGFAGADDYYSRASVAPRLGELRLPALLVNSDCDPMVPARSVRPALENASPQLQIAWISGGGHVAFPRRLNAGLGEGVGVEAQVIGWLRSRALTP